MYLDTPEKIAVSPRTVLLPCPGPAVLACLHTPRDIDDTVSSNFLFPYLLQAITRQRRRVKARLGNCAEAFSSLDPKNILKRTVLSPFFVYAPLGLVALIAGQYSCQLPWRGNDAINRGARNLGNFGW
jgi:hypothetical protein